MSTNNKDTKKIVHALARLSYVQELMAHRRVLVLGDNLELARFALDSRARLVTAVTQKDPVIPWPANIDHGLELTVMPYDDLRFREGSYDIAVIPNLSEITNPTPVLAELRRLIGPRGHCFIAAPNPACDLGLAEKTDNLGLDYYELYDLLAGVFPSVQMVGQSPFVGYAVADLSFDDPDLRINFDAGLLGEDAEEIEWFLSVCGEQPTEIDPYSVIQIPLAEINVGGANEDELNAAKSEVEQLQRNRAKLEDHQKTIDDALVVERAEVQRLHALSLKSQDFGKELEDAKLEMSNRGVRIGSLEQELEEELKQSEAARARGVKLAKELDNERKAAQRKQIEDEFAKRTGGIETQTKLKDTEQKLRQAEERARSAEAGRDSMVDQMRGDAQELDTLRERFDKAVEQYRQSKERERSIQAELQEADKKLQEANKKLQEADKKLQEANKKQQEIDKKQQEANKKLQEAQQRSDQASSKFGEIEKKLKEFEGKEFTSSNEFEAFEKENSKLEEHLKETAANLAKAKHELKRREAIVRDLVVELESKDLSVEPTEDKTPQLEELIEKLEMENAALWGAKAGQHRARVEAELKLATLEDQVIHLSREMNELKARKEEELEQLADVADSKSASMNVLQQELQRSVQALQRTQEENRSLIKNRDELRVTIDGSNKLALQRSEIDAERDKQVAKLEADLQSARWQVSELEARKADATEQLEKFQSDSAAEIERAKVDANEQVEKVKVDANEQVEKVKVDANEQVEKVKVDANEQVEKVKVDANEQVEKVRAETELARSDSEQARLELASAQSKLGAKEKELETEISRRETLDKDLQNSTGKVAALEDNLERTRQQAAELSSASDAAGTLTGQLDDERKLTGELRESLNKSEISQKATAEKNEVLQKKCDDLDSSSALASARVFELEQKITADDRNSRRMEEEADSAKARVTELKSELTQAQVRLTDLESQVAKTTENRNTMETELASLRHQEKDMDDLAKRKNEEASQLLLRAEDAEAKLMAATKELNGTMNQLGDVQTKTRELETTLRQEVAGQLAEAAKDSERALELEKQSEQDRTRLQDQLGQNESLVAAMHVLREEMANESDRTRLAGADAARVAGEAEDLKIRLSRKQDEIEEHVEEQHANQRALLAMRDEVALLSDKLNHVRDAWIEEQKRTVTLADTVAGLETNSKDTEALETELDDLHEKIEQAEISSHQTSTDLDALRADHAALENEIADAREQVKLAQNETAQSKRNAESSSNESANLDNQLQSAQFELEEMKTRVVTRETDLAELKVQLIHFEDEQASVKSKLEESTTLIENLKAELEESNNALEVVDKLTNQLDDAKDALQKAQQEAAVKPEATVSDGEVKALSKAIEERENELEVTAQKNKEQSSLLESLTAQLEERENRSTGLERQLRELNTQVVEHESDIQAWEMELKFRNSRISQLEKENENLKTMADQTKNG